MFGLVSSFVSSRSFNAAASLRERTVGCCSIIESGSLTARTFARRVELRQSYAQQPIPTTTRYEILASASTWAGGRRLAPARLWLSSRHSPASLEADDHVRDAPVGAPPPLRAPAGTWLGQPCGRGDRGVHRGSIGPAASAARQAAPQELSE